MRARIHVALAVIVLAVAAVATPAGASHDVTPARVAGDDRIATAAQVAPRTARPTP